jgi:DNA topoisomerase-1
VEKGDYEGTERNYQSLVLKGNDIKTETLSERTGSNKNKLVPSDIGKVVTDFLMEHFDQILDYKFTANVEKEFDEIAKGLKDWSKMIDSFYNPFHKTVDHALENADRVSGERLLGQHPETGEPVIVRVGRYGPMVQVGEAGGEEKPKFASLRKGQSIEKITFEEALELFKLPRMIGQFEDADMKVAIGRFGPYILHKSKFYSLPKDVDPMTVSQDEGVEIILAKRKKDAERMISTFEEDETLSVQNGRWGPFIKFGKKNYKIPKDQDAKALNYEDCMKLIKEQDKTKGSKGKKKK